MFQDLQKIINLNTKLKSVKVPVLTTEEILLASPTSVEPGCFALYNEHLCFWTGIKWIKVVTEDITIEKQNIKFDIQNVTDAYPSQIILSNPILIVIDGLIKVTSAKVSINGGEFVSSAYVTGKVELVFKASSHIKWNGTKNVNITIGEQDFIWQISNRVSSPFATSISCIEINELKTYDTAQIEVLDDISICVTGVIAGYNKLSLIVNTTDVMPYSDSMVVNLKKGDYLQYRYEADNLVFGWIAISLNTKDKPKIDYISIMDTQ